MTTAPDAKRETWADWLPPGEDEPPIEELITRAELLDYAAAIGYPTNVNSLRYWERLGAFPRAVRKGRDGGARALYPRWTVWLIPTIEEMRKRGKSWDELTPHMHTNSALTAIMTERTQPRLRELDSRSEVESAAWHAVRRAVTAHAQLMKRRGIVAVEVRYLNANGNAEMTSTYDVPPDVD
jgi:hypothetical protein